MQEKATLFLIAGQSSLGKLFEYNQQFKDQGEQVPETYCVALNKPGEKLLGACTATQGNNSESKETVYKPYISKR